MAVVEHQLVEVPADEVQHILGELTARGDGLECCGGGEPLGDGELAEAGMGAQDGKQAERGTAQAERVGASGGLGSDGEQAVSRSR
jgi:hypothetical protein